MQKLTENGLYDIYPLWHVPFWQTTAFRVAIIIICLILVSILCWLFIRWYFRKQAVPKTAWENALEQLTQLQHKKYQSKEEGKQCYFAMTTILKNYLAARYAYPLDSKTDEEVVVYLVTATDHKELAEELKEIIDGCLYIKFANAQAMQESIEKHLEQSCLMVKKTIPIQIEKQ